MRLTYHTDYTLRVLLYLENLRQQSSQKLANIQDIAEMYKISENHLMKVVHKLGKAGYIETIRGRGGGIRLISDPSTIILGQLVRETEEDFYLVECFNHQENQCLITSDCLLRGALQKAMNAFLTVLDSYTLADISRNPTLHQHLIQIERRQSTTQA